MSDTEVQSNGLHFAQEDALENEKFESGVVNHSHSQGLVELTRSDEKTHLLQITWIQVHHYYLLEFQFVAVLQR